MHKNNFLQKKSKDTYLLMPQYFVHKEKKQRSSVFILHLH